MKRNKQKRKTQTTRRSSSRIRKNRTKSILHFGRGLVMEGLGVAMLAMLYWTIQASSANEVVEQTPSVGVAAQAPTQIQIRQHIANSQAGRSHLNW